MNFDRMARILGGLREYKQPLKTTEAVRGTRKSAEPKEDHEPQDGFLDFLSTKTKSFSEFEDMAAFAVSILRASTYPFFVVDKDMKIQFMNPACLEFTGLKLTDAIGKVNCAQIFNSDLCEKHCAIKQAMKTHKSVIGKRVKVIDQIGREHSIVVSAGPLIDKKGRVLGGFEVWRDAMPDDEVNARIKHLLAAQRDYSRSVEAFLDRIEKKPLPRELESKEAWEKFVGDMKKRTGDFRMYCSTTMKSNCWEILDCPPERQVKCPSFPNHGSRCWTIDHTWCDGQMQGRAADKKDKCHKCLVQIRGKLK
ncbi:MAG: PAS domain-containing protein [Candidatus Omnitrophica bacterium]|nr:PAS domain-containing protein [Candidatus Omnitrophota bacterium]